MPYSESITPKLTDKDLVTSEDTYTDEDFLLSTEPEVTKIKETDTERAGRAFSEEMQRLGFDTTLLQNKDNPFPVELHSLVLVNHATLPDEPTIRLYRGVRTPNGEEMTHQVGYLLKKPVYHESGIGLLGTDLESQSAFDAVTRFSENPTYRGMLDMVNATDMTDQDRRFVLSRISRIQRAFLSLTDRSLMQEMEFQHVAAPGGSSSQDLSPFVATSVRSEKAARYGSNLMILDVPVSAVSGVGESDEALVMGEIKPEWITAVANFKVSTRDLSDAAIIHITDALGGAAEQNTDAIRAGSRMHRLSKENYAQDSIEVNSDLIQELLEQTEGDGNVLQFFLNEKGVTTYQEALWATAQYYLNKSDELFKRDVRDVHEMYDLDEINESQAPRSESTFSDDDLFISYKAEPRILKAKDVAQIAKQYHRESTRMQERATNRLS